MPLPTALVPVGAGSSTTSVEFPGAVLLIDVASRSRVQMEHATRSMEAMDHTEAPLIGPDTLMKVGELGGKKLRLVEKTSAVVRRRRIRHAGMVRLVHNHRLLEPVDKIPPGSAQPTSTQKLKSGSLLC